MVAVASQGFRAIAHDRRGHGRSEPAWAGHDMDEYADDLAALIETLALQDVSLVGHSTGGGEITRYAGRHGTGRIGRRCCSARCRRRCSSRRPTRTACRSQVFDAIRAGVVADRSQFYQDLSGPFYGANRPGAKVSQGQRDAFG